MGKFGVLTVVAGVQLLIIFGFLGLGAFGYAQRPDPASNVVPLAAVVLGSIAAGVSLCGLVGAIYRSKFMVILKLNLNLTFFCRLFVTCCLAQFLPQACWSVSSCRHLAG